MGLLLNPLDNGFGNLRFMSCSIMIPSFHSDMNENTNGTVFE